MSLGSNLILLWKNRKALKIASSEITRVTGGYMKSGIYSTEFWITILTSASTVMEAFKGNLDPKWSAVITAGIAVGYSLARALTKAASISQTTPTAPVVAPVEPPK